jgi:hypothetical protein
MASYPVTVTTLIDFGNSPTFPVGTNVFTLGDATKGRLDYNYLGTGTSNIVDVSSQVALIQISGGYQLQQDQFQSNNGLVRIYDPNGWWNPQNTTSPYYGYLTPNKKITIQTTYSGTTRPLFAGYINAYQYSFPTTMSVGYVDLQVADAFRLFAMSSISTLTGATAGQTTGQRINTILDNLLFPSNLRNIDTGDNLVQADPGTQRTALNAMKNVEYAEQGAFFIESNGYATFKSRSNVMKTNGAAPITYFANDGSGIVYAGVTFAHDDKLVVNQCSTTNIGGTAQNVSDAASIAKYFPHTVQQTNVVGYSDSDALNISRIYVATRKDTTIRIDQISLDLTTPNYDAGILAALTLDYFNTVNIKNVQSNGSTITKTLQVMGSNYKITPNTFDISFTTSEPIVDGFILDSSLYGVLDTSTLGW